jgi:hypothetical protein
MSVITTTPIATTDDPEFNFVGKPARKAALNPTLSLADIVERYTRWYNVPGAETIICEIDALKSVLSATVEPDEYRKAHEAELRELDSLARQQKRLTPALACRLYRKFISLEFLREPMFQDGLGSMPACGMFPVTRYSGGIPNECTLRFSGGTIAEYKGAWSPPQLEPFFNLDSWPKFPRPARIKKAAALGVVVGFIIGLLIAAVFFRVSAPAFAITAIITSLLVGAVFGYARLERSPRARWFPHLMALGAVARFTNVIPENLSQQLHTFIKQFDHLYWVAKVANWDVAAPEWRHSNDPITKVSRTVDPGFILIGQIDEHYWLLATSGLNLTESDVFSQTHPSLLPALRLGD